MNGKEYNKHKLIIGIVETVLSLIILLILLFTGLANDLEANIVSITSSDYFQVLIFVGVIMLGSIIIFTPFSYYSGYYLEHKFKLSNQKFYDWLKESAKGLALLIVIGVPLLLVFRYIILTFDNLWWVVFGVFMFFFSVILAQLFPIVILPLFYKIIPLENETLKGKIKLLADDAGIEVENIFSFDMSKNTKKANAAFTGIGKTKRIILGDNLLSSYSEDEIETVVAHELGHYKNKHIMKNLFMGTFFSFCSLFLIHSFTVMSLNIFNIGSIQSLSAILLFILFGMLVSFVQNPISNFISRKFEYEADEYAVKSTAKKSAFINTLEKLTEQNLGDKEPHPFVEWYFYGHPSVTNRINAINKISIRSNN